MKDKLVTLAIHTIEQALQLQHRLEKEGIPSFIKKIRSISTGVRVRVREVDLQKAIYLVERIKSTSNEHIEFKSPFILVPIDFSEHAIHAAKLAFYLAENLHSSIVFLHVETFVNVATFPTLLSSADEKSRLVTKKIKERNEAIIDVENRFKSLIANQLIPNIHFNFELKNGIPEEEIISFAMLYKPLLIVMGTRSKANKEQELIGSVTAEVIERSLVPVFVLPQHTHLQTIQQIKHIGFATNFDKKELVAFEKLMYFVQKLQFKVSFIHVDDKEDIQNKNKLDELKSYFLTVYPHLQLQFSMLISEKSTLKELENYIRDQKIDILAIRNHKRRMFVRLFAPSLARKLVYQAKNPMIVFY